jgi:hypothetical protein
MSDGGKGSDRRPMEISEEKFASNWQAIFRKQQNELLRSNETTGSSQGRTEHSDSPDSASVNLDR